MSNSYLFREESDSVISSLFNEKVAESKLLTGGMFNTTYFVKLESGKKAVLRLGPIERHRLLGYERNLMVAEKQVYDLIELNQLDVPHPKTIKLDTSNSLIDRHYMISEFEEGVALCNANIEKAEIYKKIGVYLKRLHGITSDKFGYISDMADGKSFDRWDDFIEDFILTTLESCAPYQVFSKEEADNALSAFYNNRECLKSITEPHLVHNDMWEGNVLVKSSSILLLDMDRAVYGDIDFEFSQGWLPLDDVFEGYLMDKAAYMSPQRIKRREIYKLCFYLQAAYIGKAEYADSELLKNSRDQVIKLTDGLK